MPPFDQNPFRNSPEEFNCVGRKIGGFGIPGQHRFKVGGFPGDIIRSRIGGCKRLECHIRATFQHACMERDSCHSGSFRQRLSQLQTAEINNNVEITRPHFRTPLNYSELQFHSQLLFSPLLYVDYVLVRHSNVSDQG